MGGGSLTNYVISRSAVVEVVHFTIRAATNQANGRSHHRTNDTPPTLITNVAPPPFPGCPQRPPQALTSPLPLSSYPHPRWSRHSVLYCNGVKRCTSMKIVKIPHRSPTCWKYFSVSLAVPVLVIAWAVKSQMNHIASKKLLFQSVSDFHSLRHFHLFTKGIGHSGWPKFLQYQPRESGRWFQIDFTISQILNRLSPPRVIHNFPAKMYNVAFSEKKTRFWPSKF